jgi:hypothetical protein
MYMVHAECEFPTGFVLSSPASPTTWKWGDIDGDGDVDALDIVYDVDAFKGRFANVTFEQANLWGNTVSAPCTPDATIDALDIVFAVDAFKGFAYPYPCPVVCP